jgi:diguanylate cyclase (GGDEF)-like protein
MSASASSPLLARLWPRSVRHQLAGAVALLVGVLAVTLALLVGEIGARHGRSSAGLRLHTVADNAARLLGEGLLVREREVRVLAESPTLWSDGLASERVRQVLHRSQVIHPHSVWIGVTDAAGTVRAATQDMLVGADVSQRPWWQAGAKGVHVGDVHPAKLLAKLLPPGSDGGPQRFVDFAAPIVQHGRLLGVIGIHGSWDWTRATLEGLLPEDAAARGLEVFVFDRTGQPIYASARGEDVHRRAGQQLPTLPAAGTAGASAHVVRWADGQDYLTSAAPLRGPVDDNDLGWTIVTREPLAVSYAGARHIATVALLLGLSAALVASMIGMLVARRLTAPLRRISQAAASFERGAAALPAERGSIEVERLSSALSAMAGRLVAANAELEQRVAERTAELEQANARLADLARHDPMTGLLNRRGLDDRLADVLASARRRAAPVSLLVLDADHFKRINDRHGHDAGDQVLRALAEQMRQRLRAIDVVARIGGEEFVAVLPDTDAAGALQAAQALVARVAAQPLPVVGHVTVSIGVATLALGRETVQDALQRADEALYRAKAGGRNRAEAAAAPAHASAQVPATEAAAAEAAPA